MLSTRDCIEILNEGLETPEFSAEESMQIRGFLFELSEIAFEAYNIENDTDDTREFERQTGNRLRSG